MFDVVLVAWDMDLVAWDEQEDDSGIQYDLEQVRREGEILTIWKT